MGSIYKTRNKMLNELNLPTLQSRRQKQRLSFFYKVVEGQVPAMPPDLFVKYQKSKRQIRARKIDNCIINNIVTSSVRSNSKCIVIPPSRTDQYKHSFFVQTAVDWNHLDENTVSAEKLESFNSRSRTIAIKSLSTRHIIAQQGSYDVTLQIQIQILMNVY